MNFIIGVIMLDWVFVMWWLGFDVLFQDFVDGVVVWDVVCCLIFDEIVELKWCGFVVLCLNGMILFEFFVLVCDLVMVDFNIVYVFCNYFFVVEYYLKIENYGFF